MRVAKHLRAIIKVGLLYLRGQRPISWYVKRGLRIGTHCNLLYPFDLDPSHCWLIELGDDITFASEVRIVVHDASTIRSVGHARIAPVRIGSRVFVGARTTILPGVTIGDDVVIGAGSVVSRDIPPGTVAVGNPARVHDSLEHYNARIRERFAVAPHFGEPWTVRAGVTEEMKMQMKAQLADGEGFVV
jgi:maltose O-acetyltransferase